MSNVNFGHQVVTGSVVLERLNNVSVPAALRPHVAALTEAHASLSSDVRHAGVALASRKTVTTSVATANAGLEASVEELAIAVVAAGLARLSKPFAPFGGKAVSSYSKGSRVRVVKELTILLVAIRDTDPPPAVRNAVATCARHCRAVTDAYSELGAQRVDFRKASGSRQTSFDTFAAALADVKNIAKVAWREEPETFDIVFGPIENDRFGKRVVHRKKKDAKLGANVEPTTASASSPTTAVTATPAVTTTPTTVSPATAVTQSATTTKTNGASAPVGNASN